MVIPLHLNQRVANLGLPLWLIVWCCRRWYLRVRIFHVRYRHYTPLLLPAIQQSEHLLLYVAGVYTASFGLLLVSSPPMSGPDLEILPGQDERLYREQILPVSAMWLTLLLLWR